MWKREKINLDVRISTIFTENFKYTYNAQFYSIQRYMNI